MRNRKHYFNEKYFDSIDSEEKAYWLGFFYADGNVCGTKFTCALKADDASHLQRFLYDIQANDVELKYNTTNLNTISVGFYLCSAYLVCRLKELGFVERKTYVNSDYIFTQIPDSFKVDFIRGYWDGNGCIQLRINSPMISVVCLNLELLTEFCNFINLYFNNENYAKVIKDRNGYYRIIITGERAKAVCHMLYDNSTIYLERKYRVYLKSKTYDKNYHGIRMRKNGRYQAYIKVNGVQRSLGAYDTIKEALDAYNNATKGTNIQPQKYYGESLMRSNNRIV